MTEDTAVLHKRRHRLVAATLALALLGVGLALTQTSGAAQVNHISGDVRAENGVRVGAAVTLFKRDGNSYFQVAASFDPTGHFEFGAGVLPEGQYQVQADYDGCASARTGDLQVPGDSSVLLGLDLRVACDFQPIAPKRILETRAFPYVTTPPNAVRNPGNSVTSVKVRDDNTNIPADIVAVSLTVTGVGSSGPFNWLTVWDCSDMSPGVEGVEPDPPFTSNVNLAPNDVRANTVISRIGTGTADDLVCIYSRNPTDLVVDLNGWFPASSAFSGELVLSNTPVRVLDTRQTGGGVVQTNYAGGKPTGNQVIRVDVGDPVEANILNVTAIDGSGWVTVWDCTDRKNDDGAGIEPDPPGTSSVNVEEGLAIANLALSRSDDQGRVCFYTSAPMNVIADFTGFFPLGSRYTAATPQRVLETRPAPAFDTIPDNAVKPGTNGKIVLDLSAVVPPNTKAVAFNLTGTQSTTGYVTVYPCTSGSDPALLSSSINLKTGETRAALVITKLSSNRRVCIVNQNPTHLIADLVSFWPVDPPVPDV